jgi:protein-S-isoprenylcysteine O-methyltransferase Ste14
VLRVLSPLAAAAMVAGVLGLYWYGALFADRWWLRGVQTAMLALIVWALATPKADGFTRTGAYAYLRHPIHAAIIHFIWAGAIEQLSWPVLGWAETVTAGAFTRMHIEDYTARRQFPEYVDYKRRVKKLIPFLY